MPCYDMPKFVSLFENMFIIVRKKIHLEIYFMYQQQGSSLNCSCMSKRSSKLSQYK